MWYLTSTYDSRVIYLAPAKKEVIIGRSTDKEICDFSVPDDASISRKHAVLTVSDDKLTVTDLGSKYGTFVNQHVSDKNGIEPKIIKVLHEDDNIRFGAFNSIWTVNKTDFVTCASTLKGENIDTLKNLLGKLGGLYKTDWEESCSYLTMPAITLTIKVVLALVQGANIVSLEFWKHSCKAIECFNKLPNPKEFLPEVIESTLNKELVSFAPNIRRRKLFADKKIIFLSRRQLEMYKSILKLASGEPILLSESKMTKAMLAAQNSIIIQYVMNNTTQESQVIKTQIDSIVSYLSSKGKRVVADAEIGLAILFSSIDKYCNPDFRFNTEIIKQSNNLPSEVKTENVLAQDTPDLNNVDDKSNMAVKESASYTEGEIYCSKNSDRPLSKRRLSGEVVESVAKKMVSENNKSIISNDDSEDLFNFKKIESSSTNTDSMNKNKLNFAKPLKRKTEQSIEIDDDNLFNFIPDKKPKTQEVEKEKSNVNMFDNYKKVKELPSPVVKKPKLEESVKSVTNCNLISNTSFKSSFEYNASWKSCEDIIKNELKSEMAEDSIEEKMADLDVGETVVVIKVNLIVEKKERPIQLITQPGVVNFKKFKKVWPLKKQDTIIPLSSMNSIKPDASSIGDLPVSDDENDMPLNIMVK